MEILGISDDYQGSIHSHPVRSRGVVMLYACNTECLATKDHSEQRVWRVPRSPHAQDIYCRFQKNKYMRIVAATKCVVTNEPPFRH